MNEWIQVHETCECIFWQQKITKKKEFKCCRIIYKRKIVMHKKSNVADMNNEVKNLLLLPPRNTLKEKLYIISIKRP